MAESLFRWYGSGYYGRFWRIGESQAAGLEHVPCDA